MIDPPPPLPPIQTTWSQLSGSLLSPQWRGFKLQWGNLSLVSERAGYQAREKALTADGAVAVALGQERITGENLKVVGLDLLTRTMDKTGFSLTFSDAQLFSSALYLKSQSLSFSSEQGATAQQLRFVPGPAPHGELELSADRVRSQPGNGKLAFDNATIRLLGNRLVTIPHLSLTPRYDQRGSQQSLALPILYRTSRVSGVAAGVRLPFAPVGGVKGIVLVESTSRQGMNGLLTLHKELLEQPTPPRTENLSLLGRLNYLTQRDKSFEERVRPLLTTPTTPPLALGTRRWAESLSAPATLDPLPRQEKTSLALDVAVESNREFVRRTGFLLRSRLPELRLTGRIPGASGEGGWLASLAGGPAQEKRLDGVQGHITSDRFIASLGWEAPRLPLGNQGQVHAFLGQTEQRYPHSHYSISELRLVSDYGFTAQTGLSGGLALRRATGKSPFLFDTLEANNEAQLRGQTQLGSITVALLGRWDLRNGQLFDQELALGWRGKTIEPRLTWRKQNRQFGFTLSLPALTGF